ncbi:MAG: alpha/beta hydrolase [Phycisphaerales bacterium]|nr:alpha/beta hydrolase [Phycisphaerales bacterium]
MLGLLILLFCGYALVIVILVTLCTWNARRPRRHAMGWALANDAPLSPASLDIPFEEWTLDRPDNVRLTVWDVPGLDPTAPCLILLHGWSRSRLTWLVRLGWWRDRASRIIIPDFRGHGDSTPDGSTLGDADAQDIAELITRSDATRIVLVGRSMGSVVAIKAAGEHTAVAQGTIQGVIAVAPYERLADTIRARLWLHGLPTTPVVQLTMLMLRVLGFRDRSTTAASRNLDVPLLVIQGGRDPVSNLKSAREICEASPAGELIVVDDAAHGDHWDLEGPRLDEAVERFLAQVSPPA